jgi:hypothetical protein
MAIRWLASMGNCGFSRNLPHAVATGLGPGAMVSCNYKYNKKTDHIHHPAAMRLATCKASSQHTQHQSAAVLIHSSSAWHGWNSGTPLRPAPQVSGKVATCLVTGNLEPCLIGWAKMEVMEALGMAHLCMVGTIPMLYGHASALLGKFREVSKLVVKLVVSGWPAGSPRSIERPDIPDTC